MKKKLFYILLFTPILTFGQIEFEKGQEIICKTDDNLPTTDYLKIAQNYPKLLAQAAKTSTINVNFTGFGTQDQAAFMAAVNIWETILVSKVPINISATYQTTASNILASTSATTVYKNFSASALSNVWYPVALAEAISGQNLNNTDNEINIKVNQNINWSYDVNGNAFSGKYDMMTVILHEIAHGLGFTSSFNLVTNDATKAQWGQSSVPYIYDLYIQNSAKNLLTNTTLFANSSSNLLTAITNGNVYFHNDNLTAAPKLYAPSVFSLGESLSHLDESAYPINSENALMTPMIRSGEIIHNVGTYAKAILNQIGWPISSYSGIVVTANEPAINNKLIVYPNPSSKIINVLLPENYNNTLNTFEIYDFKGELIISTNAIENLPINGLSNGMYVLKCFNQSNSAQTKFIKFN